MNPAENAIDSLLIYMNDEIESHGVTIKVHYFDFEPGESDYKEFLSRYNLEDSQAIQAIKSSISRRYIKKGSVTRNHFKLLMLTTEGQERAISAKLGKYSPNKQQTLGSTIVINTLHSHGNTQVGNGNIMNIETIKKDWLDKIQKINAPEEEKDDARDIISRFFEHPLLCSILGGLASGLPK